MSSITIQKTVIFAWIMLVMTSSSVALFWTWNGDLHGFLAMRNPETFKIIAYTFLAGVLGGSVYACRGFYQSIAEPDGSPKAFDFKWIFWYLIRPFASGIFGFVVYALVRGGLVAFGLTRKLSGNSNLTFFALAFLAGFSFHEVGEFLRHKMKSLFKREGNHDESSNL